MCDCLYCLDGDTVVIAVLTVVLSLLLLVVWMLIGLFIWVSWVCVCVYVICLDLGVFVWLCLVCGFGCLSFDLELFGVSMMAC